MTEHHEMHVEPGDPHDPRTVDIAAWARTQHPGGSHQQTVQRIVTTALVTDVDGNPAGVARTETPMVTGVVTFEPTGRRYENEEDQT